MNALFDANIFISYLLSSRDDSSVRAVMKAAFVGGVNLLIPHEVIEEMGQKLISKPYLSQHVTISDASILVDTLKEISVVLAPIGKEIPMISRDLKDDYLIAYAIISDADCIVTGDRDLLDLVQVERVRILTPAQLLGEIS